MTYKTITRPEEKRENTSNFELSINEYIDSMMNDITRKLDRITRREGEK